MRPVPYPALPHMRSKQKIHSTWGLPFGYWTPVRVVPRHHLPTSLPQRGGRSLASQERENKGDLGGAKMRFVEGAERAAHLRADGLSTLQSQPRNVGRTAAAPAGRQTRCGGLNQTGNG